jgi:hypothetical protein
MDREVIKQIKENIRKEKQKNTYEIGCNWKIDFKETCKTMSQ